LNFVRLVQEEQTRNFSESRRQKVKKLEEVLSKANKVQQALQTIKKGNTNTEVLSNVTGLSKDEINVLKIRITRKPIRIAGPIKRRKILDVLITDKDPAKIQKELEINDFEMDDMKEQMFEYKQQKKKYKKATSEQEKQEIQEQIEKNTRTRVVVLYTKIGKKPEFIAKVLKKQPEEIQEDLAYAIEKGIILEEQLQGIDPLNYCSNLREQAIL
jgi:flagellar motility protein MotE (MotC chaperone)